MNLRFEPVQVKLTLAQVAMGHGKGSKLCACCFETMPNVSSV